MKANENNFLLDLKKKCVFITKFVHKILYNTAPYFNHNTTQTMSIFALILLAFSMSVDAFAAAIGKGAALKKPSMREIVRTALIFGGVEMLTPVIGWLAGQAAQSLIAEYDHWLAFGLLLVLGVRMIREGLSSDDGEQEDETTGTSNQHSLSILIITAIATSIDSMVVGVSLAFLDVNIMVAAIAIGCATTLMAGIGMKLGGLLGTAVGKRAELFGGLVLIGIGTSILVEHLGLLA